MGAIAFLGTKYGQVNFRNADGDITASIATVTAKLNEATELYTQAMSAIAACDNEATGCLSKTGRHISTWRDQRNRYAPLIDQYKKELAGLLDIQKSMASGTSQTAEANKIVADAQNALTQADNAKTMSSAVKWLLIIGGIAIVVIGVIFIYKKIKK